MYEKFVFLVALLAVAGVVFGQEYTFNGLPLSRKSS
jgi:hypothetical protein